MSNELKPCPFCGSEKIEYDDGDESSHYRCRNCGASSGRTYYTDEESSSDDYSASDEAALAAWNNRPPVVAQSATTEAALLAALDEARRVPLTDAQIVSLWEQSTGHRLPNMGSSKWQLLAVARAIETAHGITATPADKEQA